MKTKSYRTGKYSCRSYCKKAGLGWEVGFVFAGKPVFVGNFIHSKEANRWFTMMNRELRTFAKRYKVGPKYPKTWFSHFVQSYLYKKYYTFLSRTFPTHNRTSARGFNKNLRTYKKLNKRWTTKTKSPSLRAA